MRPILSSTFLSDAAGIPDTICGDTGLGLRVGTTGDTDPPARGARSVTPDPSRSPRTRNRLQDKHGPVITCAIAQRYRHRYFRCGVDTCPLWPHSPGTFTDAWAYHPDDTAAHIPNDVTLHKYIVEKYSPRITDSCHSKRPNRQ